jgi:tetratricopeptide (TPR) repeat protein
MPYLQHPAVGPDLRFARSDHTIPIPRPGTDDRMGIVNACALADCHADSTLQSLEEITRDWYGELKPRKPIIEAQAGSFLPESRVAAAGALLLPQAQHPIAQVAAMGRFVKQYLQPNMSGLEPEIVQPLMQLAGDENLDVKSVALAALHFALGENPDTRRFLADELESLTDLDHPVRARWVIALQLFGDWLNEQRDHNGAITVYEKALEVMPDHANVLYGLGFTYDLLRDFARAVNYYERSLAAAPNQVDVRNDLALARQNLARARGG